MRTVKKKKTCRLKRKKQEGDEGKELSVKAKQQLQELSNNMHELQLQSYHQNQRMLYGWMDSTSTRKVLSSYPQLDRLNRTTNIMSLKKTIPKKSIYERPQTGKAIKERLKCSISISTKRPYRYKCRSQPSCPYAETQLMLKRSKYEIHPPASKLLKLQSPCNTTMPDISVLSARSPLKKNIHVQRLRPRGFGQMDLGKLQDMDHLYLRIGKARNQTSELCLFNMSARLKRNGCPPKKYLDYMSRINRLISEERVNLQQRLD